MKKHFMIPTGLILSDGVINLRMPTAGDGDALVEAVQESVQEIMPWMDWCTPDYSREIALPWLVSLPEAWESGRQYALAITDAQTGDFLGGTGLNHLHPVYRLANLGYWVRSSKAGQGVATRAARLAGAFGVQQVGLLRTEIVVAVGNHASLRVAEKSGARREGVLRDRLTVREHTHDAVMFSFTRRDFQNNMETVQ